MQIEMTLNYLFEVYLNVNVWSVPQPRVVCYNAFVFTVTLTLSDFNKYNYKYNNLMYFICTQNVYENIKKSWHFKSLV